MNGDRLRMQFNGASGRGVFVAVVDSGWKRSIRDARVLPGASMVGEDPRDTDDHWGHGTLCALRVLQVAPESRVIPIKVIGCGVETSVVLLCRGIRAALDMGANVVNVSLATRLSSAVGPVYQVCEEASSAGCIVVASADNARQPAVPAYLHPVLSVEEAHHSSLFDFTFRPDRPIECTAAGAGVALTTRGGWSTNRSGCSIAAATMSGIVARLLQDNPTDLAGIRARLSLLAARSPPTP